MSGHQEQPRRPSDSDQHQQQQEEAVRYGEVFPVSGGGLAEKPVAPQDAAMMQSAESRVFGQTLKGGPAAAMQSAAAANERRGVDFDQATAVQGVTVSVTEVTTAGQVIDEDLDDTLAAEVPQEHSHEKVTIGEALQATALAAGDVPVERSDAAAIQVAEARATGGLEPEISGGMAAQAQRAAVANDSAACDEDKTTIGDILTDARAELDGDKPVETSDALKVADAESRNKQQPGARPGGVGVSMASAAWLNRDEVA